MTLGVAIVFAAALSRRLKSSTAFGFLLIASTGLVLSATLTPLVGALENGITSTGACDLGGPWLIPLSDLLHVDDRSLNILLFVPLGVTIGLMAVSQRSLALALGALALPFAIEITQMLVPALGRGCEAVDVLDNLTGLVVGAISTIFIRRLVLSSER